MSDAKDISGNNAPKWFIILAVVMTIWNIMGVMAFFMQMGMTAEDIATLPAKEQLLYQNIPIWVNIAFACAVLAGALGCITLALRKALALPILLISLLGVLVQMFHSFFIAKVYETHGAEGITMPVVVILIAIFLVWLAKHAKSRGWLN